MADYAQPEYPIRRVRYFDNQFLKDQDFVDDQMYQLAHQRRRDRILCVAGIAEGLAVTKTAPTQITVAPGTAVDRGGRQVLLADPRVLSVDKAGLGPHSVYLLFHEDETDSAATGRGAQDHTRFTQVPEIKVVAPGALPDGALLLADVDVANDGTVAALHLEKRQYTGLRLPGPGDTGPVLRNRGEGAADWAQLDGSLSVAGGLSIAGRARLTVSGDGAGTDAPALTLENPGGSQIVQAFTFKGVARGSLRVDGSGNLVLNAGSGSLYLNNDFGGRPNLVVPGLRIQAPTGDVAVEIAGSVSATGVTVPSGLYFTNTGLAPDKLPYGRLIEGWGMRFASPDSKWCLSSATSVVVGYQPDGTDYGKGTLLTSGNAGIGTNAPKHRLHVVGGHIAVEGFQGNCIYTWNPADTNWRTGMHNDNATVGFARQVATSHVQYATFWSSAGQGFAVGDASTRLSAFEVTGSGSGYQAYFRGPVTANRFAGDYALTLNDFQTVNPTANVCLASPPGDRDAWIFRDSADTGSNWGLYHRQIDAPVKGLPANSIGFIGGGTSALHAYVSLQNGDAFFAGNAVANGGLTTLGNLTLRKRLVTFGTTDGTAAAANEVLGGLGFYGNGVQHGQLSFRAGKGFELIDCSASGPAVPYAEGAFPYADLRLRNLGVMAKNYIELGAGLGKADGNNGKIGYQTFTDGLDIVGAGAGDASTRKITFHAQGGAFFAGQLAIPQGAITGEIGIATQKHGATSWPYETIQMNPAHNLRLWFGTRERFRLQSDGALVIQLDSGYWVFQTDGNLVKYRNNGSVVWALNNGW